MTVIVNKNMYPLKIHELKKVIPADGKPYIIPAEIVHIYEKDLYIIPDSIIEEIEQMKREFSNERKRFKLELNTMRKERDSLKIPFNSLKEKEENLKSKEWIQIHKKKKISNYKFDFLYSFHFNDDLFRKEALERLKYSIISIRKQNVNICVSNTSNVCVYDQIRDLADIRYIFKPLDIDIHNKPKTINYGVKMLVKTPYFFHSDIDLIYPPSFIKEMAKYTLYNESVRVVFHNYNLGSEFFSGKFKDYINHFKKNKDITRSQFGLAPGNGLIHLESFKKVRGLDESFIGYGPEDAELNFRLSFLCRYFQVDDNKVNTYHLYHDRAKYSEQYSKNCLRSSETKSKIINKIGSKRFRERWHLKYLQINDIHWGEL
jgi:hypothetical protein